METIHQSATMFTNFTPAVGAQATGAKFNIILANQKADTIIFHL